MISGRRMHHYRRVFPIIVGAYMIVYSIIIPLSFKFILLLGSKTLLISKLALFLSMIGNLKNQIAARDPSYTPNYFYNPYQQHRKNSFKRRTNSVRNKKIIY